jgi:hypothetical protein
MGCMEEDDMKRLWMVPILFGVAWLFYPSFSFADYIIHLNSGREFVTDRYWEEGGEIRFNYSEGILGFSKDLISSIEERVPAPPETREAEPAADEASKQQEAQKASEKEETPKKEEKQTLKELTEKKKVLKKQLDGALARLREASKNRDTEAKKKARVEMRDYATQLYELADRAKEINNGQLPEGWWED